jgi:hypothetical protein
VRSSWVRERNALSYQLSPDLTTTAAHRSGFIRTAIAVLAFGAAFGYVEAAVVVYLRAALGLVPGAIAAYDPGLLSTLERVEIGRELATLVMIAAVGWIAGGGRLERLAWAAVVFGTWDIVYYAGLRLAIGWPASLDTRDVLFLVPTPWVGPVWAPLVVSLALVVSGLTAAERLRRGSRVVVEPLQAAAAIAGGILVVLSFLVDPDAISGRPWLGWVLFWPGMLLASVSTWRALRSGRWFGLFPARRQRRHHLDPRRPAGTHDGAPVDMTDGGIPASR